MKMDTNKDGLARIWNEYQQRTIFLLISRNNWNSGDIHAKLEFEGIVVSRASVINFLNSLVDEGLVIFVEETGKGGHRKIYSLVEQHPRDFFNAVIDKFLYALWETFPDSKMSDVIKE
jgi:hypothetical protein